MRAATFGYHRPDSVARTLDLLAEHGRDAAVLAGGQSLVPQLNRRLVRPVALIDVNRVDGLDGVRTEADAVRIGAMTRLRTLERDKALADRLTALFRAAALVGHPQIRTRATIGGSLCHADPAAQLPVVALALDAVLRLRSATGTRAVLARDFFLGDTRATARRPDELLVAIDVAPPAGSSSWFEQVPIRRLVCVCVELTHADGVVTSARVAAGGVADRPVRLPATESALVGASVTEGAHWATVLDTASDEVTPPDTAEASAGYRRGLLRTAVRRCLTHFAATLEHP